jgi:hypothetical protein
VIVGVAAVPPARVVVAVAPSPPVAFTVGTGADVSPKPGYTIVTGFCTCPLLLVVTVANSCPHGPAYTVGQPLFADPCIGKLSVRIVFFTYVLGLLMTVQPLSEPPASVQAIAAPDPPAGFWYPPSSCAMPLTK